jgi:hypothetical protein
MELLEKRKLYMRDAEILREYDVKDITIITETEIRFSDGYLLDLMECKEYFPVEGPYGRKYIAARFSGAFWQFFTEEGSIIILCDNIEDSSNLIDNIGYIRSYDLT